MNHPNQTRCRLVITAQFFCSKYMRYDRMVGSGTTGGLVITVKTIPKFVGLVASECAGTRWRSTAESYRGSTGVACTDYCVGGLCYIRA